MLVSSSFKICTSLDLLSSARVFSYDRSSACLHLLDSTDFKAFIASLGLFLTGTCSPYGTSSIFLFLPEERPS